LDLTPDLPARAPQGRRIVGAIRRPRSQLWFLLPAVVLYGGFFILPTLASYWLAMYDWSGLGPIGDFVGVANFRRVFEDHEFRSAALHNVWIFIALFVMTNTVSLFLAVLLDRKSWMRSPYRAIIFLPYILSPVVTGFIFEVLLSPNIGVVNPGLEAVGLGALQHTWLADPNTALAAITVALAWQWNALATVIFMAGLQNVPPEMREAAVTDGATTLGAFRHVTLPYLAPAFTVVNVLLAIFAFRAFDLVYVIGGAIGAPNGATLVMGTVIYGNAFGKGSYVDTTRMSYAMAQGIVLFVILGVVAAMLLLYLSRRERRVY
jgi:raffinose/stachyose/melibiose transport system permease protein